MEKGEKERARDSFNIITHAKIREKKRAEKLPLETGKGVLLWCRDG